MTHTQLHTHAHTITHTNTHNDTHNDTQNDTHNDTQTMTDKQSHTKKTQKFFMRSKKISVLYISVTLLSLYCIFCLYKIIARVWKTYYSNVSLQRVYQNVITDMFLFT